VLICPQSVRSCGASAPKVRTGQEPRFCQERSGAGRGRVMWDAEEALHGCNGVVGRFGTEGAARVVALALSEEHHHT
jgi:hypothetical protein